MKKNILILLIGISFILFPISVKAVEDGVKCFYSIPIPGETLDNGDYDNKEIEFIVYIGDTEHKTAKCRMFFDDTKTYNDSIYYNGNYREGCQTAGGCEYYNCWDETSNDNGKYDRIRNSKYVYFHYGKEFYEQYYREGGKCPELKGLLENGTYYIRMWQQESTDYGPFSAKSKTLIKDGKAEKKTPTETDLNTDSKKCEYKFQTQIPSGLMKYKMVVEKITVSGTNNSTYNVTLTDSVNCNPAELKGIEVMNNGRWQEYLGSAFMQFSIYVPEQTMKQLIDSTCISDNHLVTSYERGTISLSIDNSANSTVNFNNFCVKEETGDIGVPEIPEHNCTSLLGDPSDKDTPSPAFLLTYAFKIIRYVAIVLLVVMSIMDFIESVSSQDKDSMNKAISKTVRRIIYCVLIFLLPSLLEFILTLLNDHAVNICINS